MKLLTAAALALFASASAHADQVLLDFETVGSFASISNYYDGGTDGAGNVGPALGITFGGDALGLANDGTGSGVDGAFFSNAPSPQGVMTAVGSDATMNVASGFTGVLTVSYSSSAVVTDGIGVWSGLNGTGTELASFNLAANAQGNGCVDTAYCNFSTAMLSFSGTAQSVTFGNAANAAVFDNVAIASVPEPSSVVLMVAGLVGLGAMGRRRR